VRRGAKPLGKPIDVGRGQAVVPDLTGDVEHRRRAKAAVEMIVQ
jgi:hypothetical protein